MSEEHCHIREPNSDPHLQIILVNWLSDHLEYTKKWEILVGLWVYSEVHFTSLSGG